MVDSDSRLSGWVFLGEGGRRETARRTPILLIRVTKVRVGLAAPTEDTPFKVVLLGVDLGGGCQWSVLVS